MSKRKIEQDKKKTVSKRNINQYTKQDKKKTYTWLIQKSEQVSYGCFTCWEPRDETGIDTTEGGYTRFSYNGRKVLTHKWVWEHKHGQVATEDISHLCCNERCFRPSHLREEDRKYQRSRDGCPGWVQVGVGGFWIRKCKHEVPCMKGVIVTLDELTSINPDV